MVNYFIYATDDSASTNGAIFFNTRGIKSLKMFNKEVESLQSKEQEKHKDSRIVYLHWSDRCIKVEESDVILRYKKRSGKGPDTLPHTVLDWIADNLTKEDTIQLLYVITDGAVDESYIKPCNPNMNIENVIFHAINRHVSDIDMSVASMFICNNKRYIIYCNDDLVDDTDLSNPFDYDQINIETFEDKKEELKSYIKLLFLTKNSSDQSALDEIKKLKHLQSRLYDELQAKEDKKHEDWVDLNTTDKDKFLNNFKKTKFYTSLVNSDHHKKKQAIESSISTLINYINNDKKSFRFQNLKFTQKFAQLTEVEEVLDVSYENAVEIPFPDIITLNETGVPVILLTQYNLIDKILFHGKLKRAKANKILQANTRMRQRRRKPVLTWPIPPIIAHFSQFRNMIKCPLSLISDNNFKGSIEYYYNLDAFKSMIKHDIKTGPRTRQPFTGAIVPLEEFDDYNDYILASTYFDGRQVPFNKGLLYYVLYKTCEKLEYIEPNVVTYLKDYVKRRIANTKCSLGLSDMSISDPKMRVNLTTALWYCVELSSIIFQDDAKHFTKEKMRMYSHFTEYMKEILAWFDYNIDTTAVDVRANIFQHLNRIKRIPRQEDKTLFILEQIFKKVDGFVIAEIVNPNYIYKLNYLQMDHKKVIDENVLSAEVDIQKFAHFMDHVESTDVPVCKLTMRPYFVTEDKTSYYEQLKRKTYKVLIHNEKLSLERVCQLNLTRILSVHKLYIQYVQENLKFPTMEEYKSFVLKKKQYFRGKPVVFATNTLNTLGMAHNRYDEIVKDADNPISVNEFIEIVKQSVNREKRIKREDPADFNMNELSDYIRKAESKVVFGHKKPSSSVPVLSP